jgi:hypothetical protein
MTSITLVKLCDKILKNLDYVDGINTRLNRTTLKYDIEHVINMIEWKIREKYSYDMISHHCFKIPVKNWNINQVRDFIRIVQSNSDIFSENEICTLKSFIGALIENIKKI